MRTREKVTVRQRMLAVLAAVAVVAGVAGFAGSPSAGALFPSLSGESICAALFGFATAPVPVVKSADGETVLASVEWGYNAEHNICYLVLDDTAVQTLRANPPTPTTQPPTDSDKAAAARCHNAYNPDRGFASAPVPVVKSADGQTVLASVKWGYNAEHNICYLVLDTQAQQALLDHHSCARDNSSPACPTPQPTPDASNQSARQALTALYNATGGRNWTNNTNWNTDRPLDTWHGVRTDANGKVTIVDLRDNGLTGTIPQEIGNLTSLASLILSNNTLAGTIPQEIGNLTQLTWLILSNNGLTGTIPQELGNPTGLTGVYLWANNLRGPVPLSFTALTELEHFYASDNNAICLPNNLRTWHNNIENKDPLPNCDKPESLKGPSAQELRQALTALYNATGGRNWTNNTNWNTQEPVDTWYGIHTDLDTGVPNSALVLSNNNLTGTIPPEIGNLTQLSELWLYGNRLTGTIPEEIGNLTNLTVLNLGDNNFSGPVPNALSALTNLEHFYVGGRNLCLPPELQDWHNAIPNHGAIPPCATPEFRQALTALYNATDGPNWTNNTNWNTDKPVHTWHGIRPNANTGEPLSVLFLPSNNLTGTIPDAIGNLTNLTELWLYDNNLTGTIPDAIGKLTNLTVLNLLDNLLSGSIPPEIGNLTNLETLDLNNNRLSGSIPSEIGQLTKLTLLTLGRNSLSGSIPPEIGNLTNLEILDLNSNSLSGMIPSEIGNLTNLTQLYFGYSRVYGPVPGVLEGPIPLSFSALTKLDTLEIDGFGNICVPTELTNWLNAIPHTLVQDKTCPNPEPLTDLHNATDGPQLNQQHQLEHRRTRHLLARRHLRLP